MTDSQEIKNKIIKTELVEWKKLDWLQNPNLKEMTKESFERLKNSLKKNDFIMPFNVWQNNGKTWILDGHHRKKAMEEIKGNGYKIPGLLPANFIRCKNRKEAVRLILVYSAIYANVTEDGLYEFLNAEGLDFNDLKMDVELPQIDWKEFEKGWMKDEPEEPPEPQIDKAEELKEKWGVELGQLWELGEHRLICGDCTDRAVISKLLQGDKVDSVLTDPPYGVGVNYGQFQDTPEEVKKLIHKIMPIILEYPAAALTPGVPSMWEYPQPAWVGAWIHPAPSGGCSWGFAGTNPILYYGADPYLKEGKGRRPDSIVMASDREGEEGHPTPKPVKVWEWLLEKVSTSAGKIIFDPFLGSGTTLIACERLNRKCRAIDISPAYCAVSIQRWVDLTGKEPKLIT